MSVKTCEPSSARITSQVELPATQSYTAWHPQRGDRELGLVLDPTRHERVVLHHAQPQLCGVAEWRIRLAAATVVEGTIAEAI